jgi:hypothetical protein
MNMNNKTFQCRCESIALSGAVGVVEAGRSNPLFDGKIDLLRKFHQLREDCFVAANAPHNDMIKIGSVLR